MIYDGLKKFLCYFPKLGNPQTNFRVGLLVDFVFDECNMRLSDDYMFNSCFGIIST